MTIVENTEESYSPSGIEQGSFGVVKDTDVFLIGGVHLDTNLLRIVAITIGKCPRWTPTFLV
jgi:hypothetical protein